jgi:subtilisin family serine protease
LTKERLTNRLDPQLWLLINQRKQGEPEAELVYSALAQRVGLTQAKGQPSTVEVLVRCVDADRVQDLRSLGIDVHFSIEKPYTLVSGKVTLDTLEKLEESDFVDRVEASSPLDKQLDISLAESCAIHVHQENPSVKGKDVIVGVIDTGIDYTHKSFRNSDGTSRILYLWNQGADTQNRQGGVPYGREYTQDELNAALRTSNPLEQIRYGDTDGHGTHVAGIAAANGLGCQGKYVGVAPEADLIVVAFESDGEFFGNSTRTFDAFDYIISRADAEDKPVAINLSLGDSIKRRAGETILEQLLNQVFLRKPRVIVVCAAGNEQEKLLHAGGNINQGETVELDFEVGDNNSFGFVHICYDDTDQISVALQPPESCSLGFVTPDEGYEFFQTFAHNHIHVKYECNRGDRSATIFLSRGRANTIQSGTWKLLLRGDNVQVQRYDIWIDGEIRFRANHTDETCTIVIPGTARRVITVGSYRTRTESGSGNISSFSSRGPTCYGLPKPEIVAPGENIVSTRSSLRESRVSCPAHHNDREHTLMAGTSMAAPHVTGAAALILSVRPHDLTCEQVKQILTRTARQDEFTDTPENAWGSGKLNVREAVEYARTVQFPRISNVQVHSFTTLSWQTDIPTRTIIRFHSHPAKLQVGKVLYEQIDNTLHTDHTLTLTLNELPAGTYYCEIVALSQEDWRTVDDNGGEFHVVEIAD